MADLMHSGNISLQDHGIDSMETTAITFIILEVNSGFKYKDTCISEVIVS
ncbi:hypothetical protein Back11_19770 [Paenibacillus baekrokdamisoli]|uniref:Uncharacterized protein n=1 Tax=Paenibacillus baekrokdamisoli TaxID=1712516 RepID=A0A3G9IQR7_9BACL|nr:hypothetical protein [Paenibacillus baekrokdamisoli]MBB3070019.1 hypothetical protein [Paenibacillus baekrokdamisoli]BBH20632.1 hypothetical protein Back11_19770 [Paenibacillus baekrokdamisoli]